MKDQTAQPWHYALLEPVATLTAILMTALAASAAAPEGRGLSISHDGASIRLHWNDITDAPYDVQARTNLTRGAWGLLETVTGTGGVTSYTVPVDPSPSRFFRVLFPQPAVTAGEPALTDGLSGGSPLYVTGSFFYPGDLIRVGGVLVDATAFATPSLLQGSLPPGLPPGRHAVEVIDGHTGAVLAVLPATVEVADPAEDPHRFLYEPPQWPPAGPAPALVDHRGHVTVLKGKDDDCDGLAKKIKIKSVEGDIDIVCRNGTVGNAMFSRGHVTVLKSHDHDCDGRDDDCDGAADLLLHSGEIQSQVTDLTLPSRGLDFVWTRTYRSRTGEPSVQGSRWTHSYDVRCVPTPGDAAVWVYDGTGRKDRYIRQPDGTFTCPGFFREGTFTGGVFRLTFADTGFWEFRSFDGLPAAGRLARIQDRNGNALTFDYDGDRLAQVTDTLGRVHTVAYTPEGRVSSVTDSTGRTVTFAYYSLGEAGGSHGDLKSVTSPPVTGTSTGNDFPFGKTVSYTYTSGQADDRANHLLLTVTDPLGQTPVQCVFDLDPLSASFQRCLSVQRGAHPPARATYLTQTPVPANRFTALRCIFNDPEGNVSEHDFDVRNRRVARRTYTGRSEPGQAVTETENRPAGKLRAGDPDLFATLWSWNNDSLCTACVLPLSNRVERVYQADLDPLAPPRQRGNLRVERRIPNGDLDGDGLRDIVVYSLEHDARFGADPSRGPVHICPDCLHPGVAAAAAARFAVNTKGTGAQSGRAACAGIVDRRDDDCDGRDDDCNGFVTRLTNPRGHEVRGAYDAAGNLVTLTRHGAADGSASPPVLAREDFEYNAYGQPTAYVHPEDAESRRRRDTYAYYAGGPQAGYLESLAIDEPGVHLTTTFEYDARGHLVRSVDARGTPTEIEVNALGQTVAKQTQGASFGERARAEYHYDAADNLVRTDVENRGGDGTLDPTNAWISTGFEYDALRRLVRRVSEESAASTLTNEFAYDGNDRPVLLRSPLSVQGTDPHHVTSFAYDERGLLFVETRAPGSPAQASAQFDYDANGNLLAARSGLEAAGGPRITEYAYDGLGRRTRATDPMGNETRFAYDACDNLVRRTVYGETADVPGGAGNRRLSDTRYGYDALNRTVTFRPAFFDVFSQTPLGDGFQDNAVAYAPNGLIVATTNDRGHGATYTYDTALFLTSVRDAAGNRVDFSYDANGNVLSVTRTDRPDTGGPDEVFVRSYRYDALDRTAAEWDNAGNTNSYAYDSRGNRVRHTDALGFNLDGDFDSISRPTSNRKGVGGSAQNTTRRVWDAASRLSALTDGNTNTTAYAYDSLDRLVRTARADGTSVTNVYDVHGDLIWTREANGTEVACVYDALGRCVQKNITPGPGVAADTTAEAFQYDGLSRLVLAANNQTVVTRAYDSLGRCVREATESPALAFNPREYARAFDAHGLMLAQTNPSGRIVEYAYDALDRVTSLGWRAFQGQVGQQLGEISYVGPCDASRITRPNGVQTDVARSGASGAPPAAGDTGWGQIRLVRHAVGGAAPVIDERTFAYDRNQNKVVRARTAPFTPGGATNRQTFAYDSLDRLVHAVTATNGAPELETVYTFDPMGNRLAVLRNGAAEPYSLDPTLPVPGDFQMNQYTVTPFDERQYDENGNLAQSVVSGPVGAEVTTFLHDYAGRLVAVLGESGPVAAYAYDALGRRVARIAYAGLPPAPALTNRYLYAGGQVCEIEDGSGAVGRSFVLDGTISQDDGVIARFGWQQVRGPFASISESGAVLYHHGDDQGSLLALTDEKGRVVERFDYDDYGAPLFLDAEGLPRAGATSSLTGVPHLFHGMEWDGQTGLYHARSLDEGTPVIEWTFEKSWPNPWGGPDDYDPKTARATRGKVKNVKDMGSACFGNNPYTATRVAASFGADLTDIKVHTGPAAREAAEPLGAKGYAAGDDVAFPVNPGRSPELVGHEAAHVRQAGGAKVQDHNSSRSNKTASRVDFGGVGGGAGKANFAFQFFGPGSEPFAGNTATLIVPVAINKGLRLAYYKTKHDTAKNSIGNIR